MSKSILYTVTDKFNNVDVPRINDRDMTEKGMYIILSASILKYLKARNPGPVDTQRLWDKITTDNNLRFDRTSIRDSIKVAFKDCLDGNLVIDFIYLSDLYSKIEDSSTWDSLKEQIKDDKTAMDILANIKNDSVYCSVVNEIKNNIEKFLSSKKINDQSDILSVDEYIRLEEILEIDFKLVHDFIIYSDFNFNYETENASINSSIEESNIIIQQNLKVEEVLNEEFIPLNIITKDKRETISITSTSKLKEFKKFTDNNSLYPNIIVGESGSGKSILGLRLCLMALKEDYCVKFINLERYSDNATLTQLNAEFKEIFKNTLKQKYFIYLDGLENLNYNKVKKSFTELISSLSEKKDSFVLISSKDNSQEINSLMNRSVLIKQSKKFYIGAIDKPDKIWIKTPLEQVIFNQIKGKAKNRGALYYSYIEKIINSFSDQMNDDYSLRQLKNDLQKLAFYSMTKYIKIDELSRYGINQDMESFLRENKLLKIDDHDFGSIVFNSIFRDFLAAGYLISLSTEEIEQLREKNYFEEYKWRYVMLFIAEWLNDDLYNVDKTLLISILYHLRQQKEFDKVDDIIRFIPNHDLEFKNSQSYELSLEKSTSFYYKGSYYESLKYAINCLVYNYNSDNLKQSAKLYNLIASSANDVYLPSLALKINDIGLVCSDERQKPRLLGNKGRAYLKLKDFINCDKYFHRKKLMNQEINAQEDLRDETDIILLKSLRYKYEKDKKSPDYILNKSKEIIKKYEQKENEFDIDDSGNKIYVYRNLSYLLPEITNNKQFEYLENDLLQFIEKANKLPKKDFGPYGVCLLNIGRYFYKKNNSDKAFNCLIEALQNFEAGSYKAEIYLSCLYLYILTNEKHYYDKALEIYTILENEANLIIDEINDKALILDLFGTEITYKDFILPKVIDSPNIKSDIENLIIF